ncbi:FAST kinase domain-containing protein 3, mitochondrial-like [Solea solea]|uniref:FAST kinase domain-containing protein 3, mitochondrial-like n=1 Tax=Solea solea TaxID=90069 RepID=UPI00272C8646|nr:FAST kinase domain-containing protein 3, mitochondrial-like [Solea solea]
MKSAVCISSSVRAVCQHSSAFSTFNLALIRCSSVGTCSPVASRTVAAQPPCLTGLRPFHSAHVNTAMVQQVRAAPLLTPVLLPVKGDDHLTVQQIVRRITPKAESGSALPSLPPYTLHTKPQSSATALVNIQSLFEDDVIPELCARLADSPIKERAEGLTTLLRVCVECGLEGHSPVVVKLIKACQKLLTTTGGIGVTQLCHLGEVAHALEGRQSAVLMEVLNVIGAALEDSCVSPREAVRVHALLALCYEPGSQQQALMLSSLHKVTQGLVHQLSASQVSDLLQHLLKFQHGQAVALVLRLSHRASQVFSAFSDSEIIQVLSALMCLGHRHEKLRTAMEKVLPERLGKCEPELISSVMEYCLQTRCRSETIFEAVAENFVCNADRHTAPQIAKQIVAMGRLNYLPKCSGQMFKKLESILSTRLSHFQPRSLIDVLHACIHLERFPLNYMSKVFSPYFLQRLQAQGQPMDKNTLRQLTQLHLSISLECQHYWGPRLPHFIHVRKFSSVDEAFETPVENPLYQQVKVSLTQVLGGKFYSTRILIPSGYTIDVEICLDEDGYILPLSQWEHTYKRVALCLDGKTRFCSNTRHLLGKEATKRRHLRRMGYEVVQIPYFEFEKLRTRKEKVQYLHDKMSPTILKFNH